MRGPQLLIGTVSVLAIAMGAAALVVDPSPVVPSSAALIAVGLVVCATTCLAGLLLARAPWGRWGLGIGVVLAMGLASIGSSLLTWMTYVLGAAAIVGLAGPWLRLWTRHHRLADAPGPVATALMSVAAVAPLYVGLVLAGSGAPWGAWLLVALAVAASALYGRGQPAGIWILRVGVPVATVPVAVSSGGVGGALLALGATSVAILAWLPAASRTTRVIAPVLPEPVERKG